MAIVYAVANGNWSSTATWNTGALPTSADDVYANNRQVTINQNVNVLSLNNGATTGVTAGGYFQPNGNYTIVADSFNAATAQLILMRDFGTSSTLTGNNFNSTGGNALFINNIANNITINGQINGSNTSGAANTLIMVCGTVTINGNVIAGTQQVAISHSAALIQNIIINGFCQSSSTLGAYSNSSNTVNITATITKAISINNGAAAVSSTAALSNVTVKEIEQGVFGAVPISGFIRLSSASGAFYKGVTTGSSTRTLSDPADIAGQVPAQSDVRFGVTYQSGSKTGSAYIPAAASVGFGVPVDNTTGTAALTPASVWDAATSSLTTSGSIGERLKNASTVDTTGDQLAALL
jgi:hypothetical protein